MEACGVGLPYWPLVQLSFPTSDREALCSQLMLLPLRTTHIMGSEYWASCASVIMSSSWAFPVGMVFNELL